MTPYEKIADELLPCMCGYEVTDGPVPAVAWDGDHFEGCPAVYRPAVAQRMRELVEARDKDIAELEHNLNNQVRLGARIAGELEAELAALKAKEAAFVELVGRASA